MERLIGHDIHPEHQKAKMIHVDRAERMSKDCARGKHLQQPESKHSNRVRSCTVLRMQALTKMGNARIRKSLCGRKDNKRLQRKRNNGR